LTASRARAIAYAVVAILLILALRFTPRLPERKPAEILLQGSTRSTVDTSTVERDARVDTLGAGESLQALLRRGGVSDTDVVAALRSAKSVDMRRIPAGMPVTIAAVGRDSIPSEIALQLSVDRVLRIKRTSSGWSSEEQRLPWTTDTVVVSGSISSNLYEAMDESAKDLLSTGARRQLTWSLADVLEYRVDMSRDLQPGDEFHVIAERSTSPNGASRIDRILAATMKLSGSVIEAIRFKSRSVGGDYFDQDGRSLRAAFLRAPVEFRRISSIFGLRKHPILGIMRRHQGTDYAANAGTPVRAVGDALVVRAGWSGGYGNLIELRHPNGYVTRYGHLRGFASGVRAGAHVTIGQTIGYVGTTGLSTGPHLHFEVIVGGAQRDPRVALNLKGGQPIPSAERETFSELRERLMASLDTARTGAVNLALH
jgi:murein DD-endopeptidase MepM/ murein hydrolase activator NlpD